MSNQVPVPPQFPGGQFTPPPINSQPIKKKSKKALWIILGSIAGLFILCVIIGIVSSLGDSKEVVDSSSVTSESEIIQNSETTNTPIPTSTPNPNRFSAGTYLVGTDINPGLYQGQGGCYWERLKDTSGSFDSIISNGNSNGQFYVEIREGDAAFFSDCSFELLDPIPEHTGDYPLSISSGEYLIGYDIQPGLYRGKEEGCYWERLKDLYGGFDSIISNGNSDGQFYVRVKDSDKAVNVSCDLLFLDSVSNPTGDYPNEIEPGVYIVGYDIQPGTYKGETEGCYWERLSDVSGGFNSIISNGNSEGQFYVTVSSSDFALSTDCALTRTGD